MDIDQRIAQRWERAKTMQVLNFELACHSIRADHPFESVKMELAEYEFSDTRGVVRFTLVEQVGRFEIGKVYSFSIESELL